MRASCLLAVMMSFACGAATTPASEASTPPVFKTSRTPASKTSMRESYSGAELHAQCLRAQESFETTPAMLSVGCGTRGGKALVIVIFANDAGLQAYIAARRGDVIKDIDHETKHEYLDESGETQSITVLLVDNTVPFGPPAGIRIKRR